MEETPRTRAGFAAIIGRPNVGKSTLLNRILGEHLAAVSQRPQTTRNRILGILTRGDDQLVLLDTPGIHHRHANLNRFMVREAVESLTGVDCILLMTEAARSSRGSDAPLALHPQDHYVLEQVAQAGSQTPVIVVINKIDRLQDRRLLLPLMATWQQQGFSRIVPISALEGDGVEIVVEETLALFPHQPHLFPEDMITDRAERFLAAELIREQVFLLCHEEVPYGTAVEILSFEERSKDVRIEAVIHVERASQKAILIGKRGEAIKGIGTRARERIGQLLGNEVHLMLQVHVERDWTHSPEARRRLGYE